MHGRRLASATVVLFLIVSVYVSGCDGMTHLLHRDSGTSFFERSCVSPDGVVPHFSAPSQVGASAWSDAWRQSQARGLGLSWPGLPSPSPNLLVFFINF